MRFPRIGYVLLLAASLAALRPAVALACAPPLAHEAEQPAPTSLCQMLAAGLLCAMLHNPQKVVETLLPEQNQQQEGTEVASLDVKPAEKETETTPGTGPSPTDPPPALQETPEPASLAMAVVGGGLGLLAWARKRRRKPKEEPETA